MIIGNEWRVNTPEYQFMFLKADDEFHLFYGITTKSYGNLGRYHQEMHIANHFIAEKDEKELIAWLSEEMRGCVDEAAEYSVARGELKL